MNLVGRYKGRQTKKCPRCGEKCLQTQPICPDCGLIFSRLEECTNRDAIKRIKAGQKQNVLMSKQIPSDKNYWKLLLYSIFLGLFGAQYFYVYRWKMGVYMLLGIFVTFFFGVYYNAFFVEWHAIIQYSIILFVGIYAFVWLNSIRQIVFRSFKIPVSLPFKELQVEDKK